MSRPASGDDRLVPLLTVPLRVGTVVAVVLVALGLAMSWIEGSDSAATPHAALLNTIARGGSSGVIAVGLLLLSLVPLGVAIGAVIGFWRSGERRYLVASAIVAVLLVASLVLSMVLLTPST
jgi:uncharacterized membrane protein